MRCRPLSLGHQRPAHRQRSGHGAAGAHSNAAVRLFAQRVIDRFKVKCGGDNAVASSLSGGNLQKFIVGREIMLHPK